MPTIEQIRAARALIGWSQSDLAEHASLSQTGIARIENGTNQPNSTTLEKIRSAFDKADVEFIEETGVKKRTGEIRTLRGKNGFKTFLDDIYETARDIGGEFCLHNAKPQNWYDCVGEEWYHEVHVPRMVKIKDRLNLKITSAEGDWTFIGSDFAEYRWFPISLFNDQSIYAYGTKLAFIRFTKDGSVVQILNNKEFSEGFRVLFNSAWDHIAKIPKK